MGLMETDRIALSHAELKDSGSYRKNVPLVNLSCKCYRTEIDGKAICLKPILN